MKRYFVFIYCTGFVFSLTGCMSRAPSEYQLDIKSGLIPPDKEISEKNLKENLSLLRPGRVPMPGDKEVPVYTSPLIEEVYVYPQKLSDDSFMSGTYIWLVVDSGDWYVSRDNGTGNLLNK